MTFVKGPTYLGRVVAVSGSTATVEISGHVASGLAIIDGHTYRIGQVGSFVRIPQGYHDLFGVVSQVGASAAPATVGDEAARSGRWMRVELVGEATGSVFERGIGQHPNIDDELHLVTERDLRRIYGPLGDEQVAIGVLSSSESIRVALDLDKLVTRHSAILGSTGSGKSTTVASILRSIVGGPPERPSARILLLDVHGEYASALGDHARVFSALPAEGQMPLHVPFWALEGGELMPLLVGTQPEQQATLFSDRIVSMKRAYVEREAPPGVAADTITIDTPVPFSLKRLWYDMIDVEVRTFNDKERQVPALEHVGSAGDLVPPAYAPATTNNSAPYQNPAARGVRRQLDLIRSRFLDRRYDFLLRPGPWEPDEESRVASDLDELLRQWLGIDRPITILDLSGVPSSILPSLVGALLRVVYDALYWSRDRGEGGVHRPLLIVMEEAHRYLSDGDHSLALSVAQRIAREGRKYGVGAMVVSQRPSEVNETVLCQCGTILALRLSNASDRARVGAAFPDNLGGLVELLPVLRTGEVIVTGEATRIPLRCRVTAPAPEQRPKSRDPKVAETWKQPPHAEDYGKVVEAWRGQRNRAEASS